MGRGWPGGPPARVPALFPRLPALTSVGQRCRLPAVALASRSPCPASRCQPCQFPSLPAGAGTGAGAACQLASTGPQQPLQRQNGGSLLGWPPFGRLLGCGSLSAPTLLPPLPACERWPALPVGWQWQRHGYTLAARSGTLGESCQRSQPCRLLPLTLPPCGRAPDYGEL